MDRMNKLDSPIKKALEQSTKLTDLIQEQTQKVMLDLVKKLEMSLIEQKNCFKCGKFRPEEIQELKDEGWSTYQKGPNFTTTPHRGQLYIEYTMETGWVCKDCNVPVGEYLE